MQLLIFSFILHFFYPSINNEITGSKSAVYTYSVDLTNVQEDRLKVELIPPTITQQEITFSVPKTVPGIYGAMNFGRNLENIQAFDKNGAALIVEQLDTNNWKILDAKKLAKMTYEVNDDWEAFDFNFINGMYRSAGSTFQDKEAFVVNNNCLFGYFQGLKELPFELTFEQPDSFYGATSLARKAEKGNKVTFRAAHYRELVDNPILFAQPDTASLMIGDVPVMVAIHSKSGQQLADTIADYIQPLLENQRKYLGGKLPVERYTFLIYHSLSDNPNSWAGDGLEHNSSTIILLKMDLLPHIIKENIYGIASHEFFHTMLPLTIHSEEIAFYDYNQPKFSQHLWLYEGTTEYFTIHMPIKHGLISLEKFLGEVEYKVQEMKQFNEKLPLTELSINAMEMQDQYYNIYLKGALVNLCLDIHLRELSKGEYGIQSLIKDLGQHYGPDRPFEDIALFPKIVELTNGLEVQTFIDQYIKGEKPVPLKAYLQKVGLNFNEKTGKISPSEQPTEAQLALRRAWINQ